MGAVHASLEEEAGDGRSCRSKGTECQGCEQASPSRHVRQQWVPGSAFHETHGQPWRAQLGKSPSAAGAEGAKGGATSAVRGPEAGAEGGSAGTGIVPR